MGSENLEAKIDVAINEIKHINDYIQKRANEFDDHILESKVFREKVLRLENVRRTLEDHIRQDFWIQGGIIGFLSTVVTAVIIKHFNLI